MKNSVTSYPCVQLLLPESVLETEEIQGLGGTVTHNIPLLQPRAGLGGLLLHLSGFELECTGHGQTGVFADSLDWS